jgi:hypothetical protein
MDLMVTNVYLYVSTIKTFILDMLPHNNKKIDGLMILSQCRKGIFYPPLVFFWLNYL